MVCARREALLSSFASPKSPSFTFPAPSRSTCRHETRRALRPSPRRRTKTRVAHVGGLEIPVQDRATTALCAVPIAGAARVTVAFLEGEDDLAKDLGHAKLVQVFPLPFASASGHDTSPRSPTKRRLHERTCCRYRLMSDARSPPEQFSITMYSFVVACAQGRGVSDSVGKHRARPRRARRHAAPCR